MAFRPPSRLQVAGAVALVSLSLAVFAARCVTSPAIPFLVQDESAPWIMLPMAPTGLMGLAPRDAPPVTHFERRFRLPPTGAPEAVLELRALRHFDLWLNGERVPVPADAGHWRRVRRIALGGRLRPGENTLRVDVTNPTGPPMLALRLRGGPEPLVSDAAFQAWEEGGRPRAAVRTGTDRVNPSGFAMPSAAEGLAATRDLALLCFVVAALVSAALRHPAAARWRRPLLRALPWLVVAVWAGLLFPRMLEIPLAQGFDARHHRAYVDFLREQHRLPLATDGWSMFHPPVYYAPVALLVELQERWLGSGEALLAWKLVGGLAGLTSALLCGALARRLFGPAAREAVFAALLAAVLPMNVYISAYLTNESLHAALACALVLATVALLRAGPPPGAAALAGWATLAALAVLTKYTAWIVVSVAAFFLSLGWWRLEQASPARLARRWLLCGATLLALAGWFYLRNWIHFGQPFPLNVDLPGETQQWWSQPGYYTPAFFLRFGDALSHPFLAGFHSAWDSLYSTLWGDGQLAGQVVAARRHPYWNYERMAAGYWLALPATLLIGVGALRSLRIALRDPSGARRAAHSFLLSLAWALLVSVLYMTLRQQDYGQAKAFYVLAEIAPLSVFFGLGCGAADRWLEARAPSVARSLFHGWLGCMLALLLLSYAG